VIQKLPAGRVLIWAPLQPGTITHFGYLYFSVSRCGVCTRDG
jgi:hypothetical protein